MGVLFLECPCSVSTRFVLRLRQRLQKVTTGFSHTLARTNGLRFDSYAFCTQSSQSFDKQFQSSLWYLFRIYVLRLQAVLHHHHTNVLEKGICGTEVPNHSYDDGDGGGGY